EPQTLPGYASHLTVDITETLEQKLESIRCYATQFPTSKSYVVERVRGAALLCGSAAGFGAGEVFVCTRALGTTNLMQSFFPTMACPSRILGVRSRVPTAPAGRTLVSTLGGARPPAAF